MSKRTNDLQRAAKFSRDIDALASGNPRRIARRGKNRVIGRALAKTGFWRWLWGGFVIMMLLLAVAGSASASAIPTFAQVRTTSTSLTPQSSRDMTTIRAQQIAAAAWGLTRTINVVRVPIDGESGIRAYTITSPPGEEQDWTVYVDSGDIPMPWEDYETMMVHEYGHLAGYDHAPEDANSVMTPSEQLLWKYGIPKYDWRWLGTVHGKYNRPTPWDVPKDMTTGRWAPRIDWSSATAATRRHGRKFVEYAR